MPSATNLHSKAPTLAVILGAGRGRRLAPITDTVPKPLLPYRGRALIDYTLDEIIRADLTRVTVITGHQAEKIEDHLQTKANNALEIRSRRQENLNGTAAALTFAEQDLEPNDELVLISASDYIAYRGVYMDLVEFHMSHSFHISVSAKAISKEKMTSSSQIEFDQIGNVTSICEKPEQNEYKSGIAASLIYIAPVTIFEFAKKEEESMRGESELTSTVSRMIKSGYSAAALRQDRLIDIGSTFTP